MAGNRSARFSAKLYDDEYEFCLRIGELIELSEVLASGPQMIHFRLANGMWYPRDVLETIRWGLEGAGMNAMEAKKLANHAVKEGYLIDTVKVAAGCLKAALEGVAFDQPEDHGDEPGE